MVILSCLKLKFTVCLHCSITIDRHDSYYVIRMTVNVYVYSSVVCISVYEFIIIPIMFLSTEYMKFIVLNQTICVFPRVRIL